VRVKAAVLGAGTWGTAFAKVLSDAGTDVTLWARRPELAQQINLAHQNGDYLPDITLPESLYATHDAAEALREAELVAIAIPSQTLRANLVQWAPSLPPEATLVSLMKGVELGTSKRMSEVIAEVAGAGHERIAVVSGPNLAREIAQEQPTATVVACVDEACAVAVQAACTAPYFRPYTNTDVIGCELGGAVKNVIALACGIAQGMGFGERLGRGESLDEAQRATHGQVAEGVLSCRSVLELAQRHAVDTPITQAVEAVCFRGLTPPVMLERLMSRSVRSERQPPR